MGEVAPLPMMLRKSRIRVEDFGEITTLPGRLFLEVLNERGIDLHNDCGGQGKCGKCRIVFRSEPPECRSGDLKLLSAEQRAEGVRLACFHSVREDCAIAVPAVPEPELVDDLPEL